MSNYQVFVSKSAHKELKKIPSSYRLKIKEKLTLLPSNPFPDGVKKLAGTPNCYRIRIGDYRVLYRIEGQTIYITNAVHRKDAYRK